MNAKKDSTQKKELAAKQAQIKKIKAALDRKNVKDSSETAIISFLLKRL